MTFKNKINQYRMVQCVLCNSLAARYKDLYRTLMHKVRKYLKGRSAMCSLIIQRVGGVEYLHRSPASRRRRQKGKSQIWDSKIWSRVPRDSDPRMNALARTSRNCKWQNDPLFRKDVIWGLWPQVLNWEKKILAVSLKGLSSKTNWLALNRQS
jgi:hypothetical protein